MWFNLWNVVFWMKPKYPKKNLSQLSRKGTLTTNSSHITESLCNYNRPKQEFCTCSTVFGTFLLPSWDEYDVKFHFLCKKSTQVDDFLFLFLNWREDGQSFLRHRKQWMMVIGNGNFYAWQYRLLISILFITITKFSNLVGYQLSWFQHSRSV